MNAAETLALKWKKISLLSLLYLFSPWIPAGRDDILKVRSGLLLLLYLGLSLSPTHFPLPGCDSNSSGGIPRRPEVSRETWSLQGVLGLPPPWWDFQHHLS